MLPSLVTQFDSQDLHSERKEAAPTSFPLTTTLLWYKCTCTCTCVHARAHRHTHVIKKELSAKMGVGNTIKWPQIFPQFFSS